MNSAKNPDLIECTADERTCKMHTWGMQTSCANECSGDAWMKSKPALPEGCLACVQKVFGKDYDDCSCCMPALMKQADGAEVELLFPCKEK
jgi:hypothetical protein